MDIQQSGMEILASLMPHLVLQEGDHFSPVALLLSAALKSVMSLDKQAVLNGTYLELMHFYGTFLLYENP